MDAKQIELVLKPHTVSKALLYTRTRFIAKLLADNKATDLSILAKPRPIIDYINSSGTDGTRRNKFLHVVAFLRAIDQANRAEPFQREADALKAVVNEQALNNRMTEKDHAKYKPLPEIQAKVRELLHRLSEPLNTAEKKDSLARMKELQKAIIIAMYTLMPPLRDDLNELLFTRRVIGLKKTQNYLVSTSKSMYIVLNEYKTAKKFGKMKLPIEDPDLRSAIDLFMKRVAELGAKPTQLFFWDFSNINDVPKLSNSNRAISNQLHSWSAKMIGAPLTINDYRHIYEMHLQRSPEYQRMTQKEKNELHMRMLHSASIAQVYNKAD